MFFFVFFDRNVTYHVFQSINEGGNVVFISELMLEADLMSEVIHLFIFFFSSSEM